MKLSQNLYRRGKAKPGIAGHGTAWRGVARQCGARQRKENFKMAENLTNLLKRSFAEVEARKALALPPRLWRYRRYRVRMALRNLEKTYVASD